MEHPPKRDGVAPTEVTPSYHPLNGLNYRLRVNGQRYIYSPHFDAWVNTLNGDDVLTGEEIHRRVAEAPVRLEVDRGQR